MKHVTCQEVEPLLPATAVGALDQDEAQEVQGHLEACSPCRKHLHQFEETVEHLAYAVPLVSPPAQLRVRVLQAVTHDERLEDNVGPYLPPMNGARRQPASPTTRAPGGLLTFYTRVAPAALAACLLLLLGSGVWLGSLSQQVNALSADRKQLQANQAVLDNKLTQQALVLRLLEQPGAETAIFKPVVPNSPAAGEAIMAPGYKQVGLMLTHVPLSTSGNVYKLWMLPRGGQPQLYAGILPPADGSGVIVYVFDTPADPSQMAGIRITKEPDAVSNISTGPSWLEAWYNR